MRGRYGQICLIRSYTKIETGCCWWDKSPPITNTMENNISQVQQEICGICHEDVIYSGCSASSGAATGSLKTSCGHIFHPKCLWKWYSTQDENNCPMCRAPATEWERVRDREELGGEELGGEEEVVFDDGGLIRITRVAMEGILRSKGGIGVTAGVEAELAFDVYGEVTITRYEFARIMAEQGATALTDESWSQLMSIYPAGEYEVLSAIVAAEAAPTLSFEHWEPEAVHVPGPFDIVDEPEEPRLTFTRAQIENFLRTMGSSCTVTEFFNEEEGEVETLVVTMTHASLEARLSSILGREVEIKTPSRVVLNPEDELEA